ncbi:MAG: D-glycero-beta-D-manno-heptose 1-phosphate adenylyltransferase [Deltaproteobacteria bacterium]|jgi:D-beta-D-heptose 7-phosphate kinase/D-beta-D-heptose 1-phosphate adenosyltransferase|nr:D-glycero-beta-D-manno-heptose 1-phosphate adenylyltransferase [Deltaproteobacteria bacterium]
MSAYLKKIMSLAQAVKTSEKLAKASKQVVFTNGCFDLLHPGHLRYLDQARGLGDFLMVGLNSDSSIRKIKGPNRPVRNQAERAEMLAGLGMVDGIVIFDEETPLNVIKALKPRLLVKGGDWGISEIVGSEVVLGSGGEVRSLTLEKGFSTTSLIERVAKAYAAESGQ